MCLPHMVYVRACMGFHARNIMYNLPYMISDIVYTYMRTHKHKYIYIYIYIDLCTRGAIKV